MLTSRVTKLPCRNSAGECEILPRPSACLCDDARRDMAAPGSDRESRSIGRLARFVRGSLPGGSCAANPLPRRVCARY